MLYKGGQQKIVCPVFPKATKTACVSSRTPRKAALKSGLHGRFVANNCEHRARQKRALLPRVRQSCPLASPRRSKHFSSQPRTRDDVLGDLTLCHNSVKASHTILCRGSMPATVEVCLGSVSRRENRACEEEEEKNVNMKTKARKLWSVSPWARKPLPAFTLPR